MWSEQEACKRYFDAATARARAQLQYVQAETELVVAEAASAGGHGSSVEAAVAKRLENAKARARAEIEAVRSEVEGCLVAARSSLYADEQRCKRHQRKGDHANATRISIAIQSSARTLTVSVKGLLPRACYLVEIEAAQGLALRLQEQHEIEHNMIEFENGVGSAELCVLLPTGTTGAHVLSIVVLDGFPALTRDQMRLAELKRINYFFGSSS